MNKWSCYWITILNALLPKKDLKGKVYFYLRYYLPGGKRVSRAAGEKKIEARKLMFEKSKT